MTRIIFATANRHKLEEVQQILGPDFELVTPADMGITEDIPETKPTIEGNASQKARYIYDKTGENCFADDTGLEVDALGGEPGVLSARYAGEGKRAEDNMAKLLSNLEGKTDRTARFRTVISLILDGREHLFEGTVEGEIITERHGTDGFGYDPVFRPEGRRETFAEMEAADKNRISHRGRAVKKLVEFLGR